MFGLPMIYLRIAAAVAVIGALWWLHHAIYQDGYDDGSAHVQTQFDGYRDQLATITQQRETENAIKAAEVKATNEGVMRELQSKYEAIATVNGSLSRKLRDLSARACITYLPGVDDLTGTPEASGEPSSQAQIDGLTDSYDQSCQRDAAQLDALITQIKPQL
jgi:hypothetical protein